MTPKLTKSDIDAIARHVAYAASPDVAGRGMPNATYHHDVKALLAVITGLYNIADCRSPEDYVLVQEVRAFLARLSEGESD